MPQLLDIDIVTPFQAGANIVSQALANRRQREQLDLERQQMEDLRKWREVQQQIEFQSQQLALGRLAIEARKEADAIAEKEALIDYTKRWSQNYRTAQMQFSEPVQMGGISVPSVPVGTREVTPEMGRSVTARTIAEGGAPPSVIATYQADLEKEYLQAQAQKLPSAPIKLADQLWQMQKQAEAAEASGDTETARALRYKIAQATPRTLSGSGRFNPQTGEIEFNFGNAGQPTSTTMSRIQERQSSMNTMTSTIMELRNSMQPEQFGVRGTIGALSDKLGPALRELGISAPQGDYARMRTHETVNQLLPQVISALRVRGDQISQKELSMYKDLAPRISPMESYAQVVVTLDKLMEASKLIQRSDLATIGQPIPKELWSDQDLAKAAMTGDREAVQILVQQYPDKMRPFLK